MRLNKFNFKRLSTSNIRSLMVYFIILLFGAPSVVYAATTSQGYQGLGSINAGMLVSTTKDDPKQVEPSTNEKNANLVGVVVKTGDASIVFDDRDNYVQVATSGQAKVLVSDINGPISAGDRITSSPISGVGMRADSGVRVVGQSQEKFDGQENVIRTTKVETKDGAEKTVNIGELSVRIQVSNFENTKDSIVPDPIQRLSEAIAGRQVSALRVIFSSILLLTAVIAGAVILFAGVKNGLLSLGRNPLAQGSIVKGLWQVSFTALGLVVASLAVAYLILRS